MRKLKFRGKRKDNGEWVYGYYIYACETTIDNKIVWTHYIYVPYPQGFTERYEVIPETVGQYIGVKDRNGMEIYDGDVLEFTDSIAYIYYDEKSCAYRAGFEPDDTELLYYMFEYEGILLCDVIGNVYDNPELLEVKK